MLRVEFSGSFVVDYRIFIEEHPSLASDTNKRIKLFKKNPQDTRLNNHALRKRMKGKFAFSITKDVRVVYEWLGKNRVRFLAIGRHSKVYKKH